MFCEYLYSLIDPRLRNRSRRSSLSEKKVTLRGHIWVAHTLSWQPLYCQTLNVSHVASYILGTPLRLSCQNHKFIKCLKIPLIHCFTQEWGQRSHRQFNITTEIFLVTWQPITQRYNNERLIAMMHANYLGQMPHVEKGDEFWLRQLINHISSYINVLQEFILNVPVKDMMLNYWTIATLDYKTQRE